MGVLSGGDDSSCGGNYRSIPSTHLSYWAHVLQPQSPLTFLKECPGERAGEGGREEDAAAPENVMSSL